MLRTYTGPLAASLPVISVYPAENNHQASQSIPGCFCSNSYVDDTSHSRFGVYTFNISPSYLTMMMIRLPGCQSPRRVRWWAFGISLGTCADWIAARYSVPL
ncbi:hypothetical protein VTN96DRAFT_6126 [Rasamsonia emersonii]